MGQTIARVGGVREKKGESSIILMWSYDKKSLVNLDKRFRPYPVGSTGLEGEFWRYWSCCLC